MKNITLLSLLFAIAFACTSNNQSGNESASGEVSLDSLKSEVLSIHDEVMPKMGDLRRARKTLMLWADSLVTIDSTKANMLSTMAEDIANANESMMVWMRAYEPDFEGTDEEVRAYLEAQKESIQKVKDDMESSLANGLAATQDQ